MRAIDFSPLVDLLKTELDRERMALELQEVQKAQAEKERRIKEQQQKIENLSTMVINSAVDDREFEKRSKRVVTFCPFGFEFSQLIGHIG